MPIGCRSRVVAREQIRPAPALHHRGELPAEIDRIADAGVHAERAGRRELMHRVAGEKHAALGIALGHHASPRPDARAQPFDLERPADGAADQRVLVDALRRLLAVAVEHHQPPHGVDRIDDADVGPQPVAVDGEEERALRLAARASANPARGRTDAADGRARPARSARCRAAPRIALVAPSQPTR